MCYVVWVLMLIWSILIYEPLIWYTTYFCSVSLYVVGSSGQTYHWCCIKEWVISEFLHFLCIYWHHTVCLFITFVLFAPHYCTTVSYTLRTIWSTTAQFKEVFMFKTCVVCSHLWLYVNHTVNSVKSVVVQWTGSYSRPGSEYTENSVISYS